MKYKRPKLGIEVNTNYVNGTPSVDYTKVYNYEVYIGVRYDMLKDMGFEQVEEVPERIHKAYNDFENDSRCNLGGPNGRQAFETAIMDNMPKQEKITYKDLDSIMVGDKTSFYVIRDLLRDKGLLQE